LLAVDGSKGALDAVRLAARMLHSNDRVVLYHAYIRLSFLKSAEPQEKAAALLLDRAEEVLRAGGVGNVEKIVEPTTDPRKAITELAETKFAQCVIMGTRGLGAVKRYMLGSTSEFVIHHVHDSVCIVHNWEPSGDHVHYMVCVDGSAHSQRAANRVASMVKSGDIVTLFNAFQSPTKMLDNVYMGDPDAVIVPSNIENPDYDRELAEAEGKADTLLHAIRHNFVAAADGNADREGVQVHVARQGSFDIRESILKKVQELNVDVVAMGSRGENNFTRMVFGSVSSHVVHHIDGRAVLIVQ
jgi:nucleotide-binding universal stress UspA family protein